VSHVQLLVLQSHLYGSGQFRKVEEIVKSLSEGEAVKSGTRKITPKRAKLPEEFNLLKKQLSGFFNTKVQLTCYRKRERENQHSFRQRGRAGTYHGNLRHAKEVNDKKSKNISYSSSPALCIYTWRGV